MSEVRKRFHFSLLAATLAILGLLLAVSAYIVDLDYDVASSLPADDPAISGARYMMKNHPLQDQLVINVTVSAADPEMLVKVGDVVVQELRKSRLFKRIGMGELRDSFPMLMQHLLDNLPILFTREDLEKKIRPLLAPHQVKSRLITALNQLAGMEGVGRGAALTRDPLGLSGLVLAKMSHLSPAGGARFYRGHLVSPDNRHLLILASPNRPGTDTAFSRLLVRRLATLEILVDRRFQEDGIGVELTAVGTFRASLDNEVTAKADTRRAILYSVAGIALLLLFSFPRPLIGIMALVPALAGTVIAFFLFSVFYGSISILTLGFGGAIISITVDHAIAYFLFLDRPWQTTGKEAARETRAVCLLALLTTVGAFLTLSISGFPIMSQIGQFAAVGIAASFIFLHTLFPRLVPELQPAQKNREPILQRAVSRIGKAGSGWWALAALCFGVVMLLFARPDFNADLASINTVRPETIAAEEKISNIWGDVFSRVYMAVEADNLADMQQKSDRLLNLLEADWKSGQFDQIFVSSMIFPGERRAGRNYADWRAFWTKQRISALKKEIRSVSAELGFSPSAFNPFFRQLSGRQPGVPVLTERFSKMIGISLLHANGKQVQFLTLKPGEQYTAGDFYRRYQREPSLTLFDGKYFSEQLGNYLMSTFLKMVAIIGGSVLILVFLFFLSWKLTLIAALPVLFAMSSTLGTLNLMGHPLDIPGLMLSIIVIGMGVDYSLFFVLSYQRYGDENHPSLGLIRMAVFLASASTLIGFGVLNSADHQLLKSAGLVSLLGIGYSLIGAFVILPPLLRRTFVTGRRRALKNALQSENRIVRVLSRFQYLEAYPRMFARFKIQLDPMFPELDRYVDFSGRILDVGCGYGVPACWILDRFPGARIFAVDPDPERVRIASRVIAEKGQAVTGEAPELPFKEQELDMALLLDMVHYLDDEKLLATLREIHSRLSADGKVVIRVTIADPNQTSVWRRLETIRLRLCRQPCYFRSEGELRLLMERSDYRVEAVDPSGVQREETWIMARPGALSEAISDQVKL